MKDERLLLEGIYAMIEEMREKSSRSYAINPTASTVDFSEITTLIKHWRTQSVEQTVNMEKSLAAKLDSISAIGNTTTNPDERLDRIIEILQQPPIKPQSQRHHHVIDVKSLKVIKYFLMQWIIILLLLGWNMWLIDTNIKLKNNDLKYRYIKSENSNNEFIHYLEKVFKYDRDRKEIRNIRKKVKKYEDELKKRAERIEIGE